MVGIRPPFLLEGKLTTALGFFGGYRTVPVPSGLRSRAGSGLVDPGQRFISHTCTVFSAQKQQDTSIQVHALQSLFRHIPSSVPSNRGGTTPAHGRQTGAVYLGNSLILVHGLRILRVE